MNYICDSCVNNGGEICSGCNPDDPAKSSYQAKRAWGADKYQDTAVLCPFYKHHDRKNIVICEGPFVRSSVTMRFYRREEMKKHIHNYCELMYERCPLYQIVMKKYEAGE